MVARALTVDQAAEFLQLSPYTIRQWLRTGKLPGRKIGRVYRILDTDLEALVGAKPEAADAVRETAPDYQAVKPKRRTAKRKSGAASLPGKHPISGFIVEDFLHEKASEEEKEERRRKLLHGYGSLAHVKDLSVESYLREKREEQQRENER